MELLKDLFEEGEITYLHPMTGIARTKMISDIKLLSFQRAVFPVNELENALKVRGLVKAGALRGHLRRLKNEKFYKRWVRLHAWHAEELAIKKSGALKRTAEREGVEYQTVQKILKKNPKPY